MFLPGNLLIKEVLVYAMNSIQILHKSNAGGVFFINMELESEVTRKAHMIGKDFYYLYSVFSAPKFLSNEELDEHLAIAIVISIDIPNHLRIGSWLLRQLAVNNHGAAVVFVDSSEERQKTSEAEELLNSRIIFNNAVEGTEVMPG